ncbi:MAG: heterodisulfide reductase-related iron-sulfur binding cluster, partial [Halobaculum sp.]
WEAGVHGMDAAAEFNDLCTGCSRCVPACPVGIDIPWINTVVRDRLNGGDGQFDFLVDGLTPDAETDGPSDGNWDKRLFGNVETLAKLGSATAPVANRLAGSRPVKRVLQRVAGVDARRDLPEFAGTTFVEWAHDRGFAPDGDRPIPESETAKPTEPPTAEQVERRAVVYPDLYTNYMDPGRGKAAVRALHALGVDVVVPDAPGSGRAPLSQGMIDTARAKAEATFAALDPYLARDVVVIEPSAAAMFRDDYEQLLDEARFDRLAETTYEVMEYVYGLLANGGRVDRLSGPAETDVRTADGPSPGPDDRVAYHRHCQSRTMGVAEYATATLEACGYEVTTTDVECCGMAGSFGYKTDYYELSMAVGEELADELRAVEADYVVAAGTSCQDQIADLLGDRPPHPVELIAPRP